MIYKEQWWYKILFLMLVLSCFVGLTESLCNTRWFGYKCLVKVTDSDFSVKCSVEPWLSRLATLVSVYHECFVSAAKLFFLQIMWWNSGAKWICFTSKHKRECVTCSHTITNTVHITDLWLVQICSVAKWIFIFLLAH